MIQRIQSVYLLLVAVLMVVAMASPIGTFYSETNISMMSNLRYALPDGTLSYAPCVLFVFLAVAAIIAMMTIFLYRKRMRQIRMTKFSSVVLVIYYVMAFYFILTAEGHDEGGFVPTWPFCLPLVSIVLNWLAIRAIKKDEMLVRSYDRIR